MLPVHLQGWLESVLTSQALCSPSCPLWHCCRGGKLEARQCHIKERRVFGPSVGVRSPAIGKDWVAICTEIASDRPAWSSAESSWLLIADSRVDLEVKEQSREILRYTSITRWTELAVREITNILSQYVDAPLRITKRVITVSYCSWRKFLSPYFTARLFVDGKYDDYGNIEMEPQWFPSYGWFSNGHPRFTGVSLWGFEYQNNLREMFLSFIIRKDDGADISLFWHERRKGRIWTSNF